MKKITFLANVILESVADDHDAGFAEDKKKSTEVDKNQLGEGQNVYLDKKIKSWKDRKYNISSKIVKNQVGKCQDI